MFSLVGYAVRNIGIEFQEHCFVSIEMNAYLLESQYMTLVAKLISDILYFYQMQPFNVMYFEN